MQEPTTTGQPINSQYPINMSVNKSELNLLTLIRTKYRYGEIIVVSHDGIPQRLKKVETFDDLHGDLSK